MPVDVEIDRLELELETRAGAPKPQRPAGVVAATPRDRLKSSLRGLVLEILDEYLAERRRTRG